MKNNSYTITKQQGSGRPVARLAAGVALSLFGLLALCAAAEPARAQQPAAKSSRSEDGTSLLQYRQLFAQSHAVVVPQGKKNLPPSPPPDFASCDEAFLQLLVLQARTAAARQSQDRLAGWNKAIKPRIDNQSIPALEVEILGLTEKQQAASVARLEAELRRAVTHANQLVGRGGDHPLVALVEAPTAGTADAEALSVVERDVLTAGRDLLGKLFQSYTVGGVEVTELLWYERQVTHSESEYREWAARAGFEAAVAEASTAK